MKNADNGKKETAEKLSDTTKYSPITIKRCGDFAEAFEMALSIIFVRTILH
ncbi:hypothetical protein [Thermoanaerobacterium thermosaccharolyticum]|uniref:hypothetical protein n=1 Tax=Thermoanaerobacterium thermosaccharolyticum TaxID=1517 RepID=UPI0002EF9C88|nr:hypothetical protein [Thermoanaerobacterium thermosaccharolyticum]